MCVSSLFSIGYEKCQSRIAPDVFIFLQFIFPIDVVIFLSSLLFAHMTHPLLVESEQGVTVVYVCRLSRHTVWVYVFDWWVAVSG